MLSPQQRYDANNAKYLNNTFGGIQEFASDFGQSAMNLMSPSYWGSQFKALGNSIDNNLIKQVPTQGAYQGTPGAGNSFLNSTGVATPSGPATVSNGVASPVFPQSSPAQFSPIASGPQNPSSAYSGSSFSPVGVSAPGIPGASGITTPATYSGSNFSPIGGGAGVNPYTTSSLVSNLEPVSAAAGGDSMFSSIGDTASSMWDGIGGWQGLQSGIQTGLGAFQAYQGMEALDLANEKFGFQKDAWQKNYNMQKDAYDRQVAQVESRKEFLSRDNTGDA